MQGIRAKIDYTLKHNIVINKAFKFFASAAFKCLGVFTPIDDKLVIFSGHSRKYNDSPRAIYEMMIKDPRFKDYKFVWALEANDKTKVPGNATIVTPDTMSYFHYCLKAKYWVTCVNIERSLNFKKRSCRYLNTWHGCPLKTIGNSAAGRKDYDFSQIDYFCSSGKYEDEIYLRDFQLRKESLIHTGLPRNDELYHVDQDEVQMLREKLGIPEGKKVILYAPTWRDSVDGGNSYSIKPPMDLAKWEKELGDEYVLLFRTHPYTNKLLGVEFNDFVRNYTEYGTINDLLKVADILVSDYSATIFDFSITEKPIICFAYDYEDYGKERGLYLDLNEVLYSGVERTEDSVLERIKQMEWDKECEGTKAFKDRFLEFGGNATKQCIEALFGNG